MVTINEMTKSQEPRVVEDLDLQLKNMGSKALARLVEEVRNDGNDESVSPTAYNRAYHRHNR